ncbi:hypothetical protein [Sulfobacillus thermosulfidooxidans]|uniref:hypothetical protein n=1 Tax=Sulfobacillus thermosulfidooxidans TaxID=28034 RepID=UPI0006B69427|nr:hypothetical protein [Sulfobacillus thermosulfidooxidans]
MAEQFQTYEQVILRIPYIKSASVYQDTDQVTRIQILSDGSKPPRQIIREVVSLLRSYGFDNVSQDAVTVVQIQSEDELQHGGSRLQIAGFSIGHNTLGIEAHCRLSRGDRIFEGRGQGATIPMAIAIATVEAVNQALAQLEQLIFNGIEMTRVGGIDVVVVTIADPGEEILAGCGVLRDTIEDTVIRATLDAVNRRILLYSGQKV